MKQNLLDSNVTKWFIYEVFNSPCIRKTEILENMIKRCVNLQFAHFDYGTWEHCFKHLVSIIKSRFLEGHYFTMRPSLFESSGCVVFFSGGIF